MFYEPSSCQMVSIKKAQVREIASLMEGALMRNEDVAHQVVSVDTAVGYNVVQVTNCHVIARNQYRYVVARIITIVTLSLYIVTIVTLLCFFQRPVMMVSVCHPFIAVTSPWFFPQEVFTKLIVLNNPPCRSHVISEYTE